MKIIITGSTGMVGEGVLLECLNSPLVEEILSISRRPSGISNPKLTEYLVPDFLSIDLNDPKLKGYDACFFCAGISSVGMDMEVYKKITYDTTMHLAHAMNPNPNMSFIYVSGGGTDSSEKGRMAWARIKGKTENDLMKLPFKQAFGYRLGFLIPNPQQKRVLSYYRYFSWLVPLLKVIAPSMICNTRQLALSMIYASKNGFPHSVISVRDMKKMASAISV